MALSEAQINGRFKMLERPVALPGKCACCGAVNKPVLDFNFDLDFYGAVYLCVECLGEAFTTMRDTFASAGSQAVPLPTVNVEAVDEYLRAVTDSTNRLISLLPPAYFDMDDSEVTEGTDGKSEAVIPDAQRDNYTQPELVSVSGPDDVSGDNSSNAFDF